MRTLYLHIGLPKTGTSYLQRMLALNAQVLLDAGIGVGPYIDPIDGDSRAMRGVIRGQGLGAAMAALAASPGDDLVVSSEHLSVAMRDRSFAEALRDAARRHFASKIVVFLRRQDRLKESLFSQEVKTWYTGDIQNEDSFDYDLDRQVADLEAVFGRENVIVLIYGSPGARDILAAFLSAIGAQVPRAALQELGKQNVSLHRRKVLMLSRVPKPDPTVQDLSFLMTRVVTMTTAVADDGIRYLMSPRERHDLVARHIDGNRALVARHGIRDAGDFVELPEPDAAWAPPAPITWAEFLAVSAQAFGRCLALRNRYGLKMAGKVARMLPEFRRRLFDPSATWPRTLPPPLDLLPVADMELSRA